MSNHNLRNFIFKLSSQPRFVSFVVVVFVKNSFGIGCWICWARYQMNIYLSKYNQGRVSCLVPEQLVLVHFRLIDYVSNHKLTNNMFQIEVTVIIFYCSICHFFLNNIFWEKWKSEKNKCFVVYFFTLEWLYIPTSHLDCSQWLISEKLGTGNFLFNKIQNFIERSLIKEIYDVVK